MTRLVRGLGSSIDMNGSRILVRHSVSGGYDEKQYLEVGVVELSGGLALCIQSVCGEGNIRKVEDDLKMVNGMDAPV